MRSNLPKPLHEIAGRSMLHHALAALLDAGCDRIAVVVGPGAGGESLATHARILAPACEIYVQNERRGTAHAVLAAREAFAGGVSDVLIHYADTPLLRASTLRALRQNVMEVAVCALGFEARDPTGYGRFIEHEGRLLAIREHKDATEIERAIRRCNAGSVALSGTQALSLLEAVGCDNAAGEFYLTDCVALAAQRGLRAVAHIADEDETMGVNDRVQLSVAEGIFQRHLRERAMRSGVTMIAPETVFLSFDTFLAQDVTLEPHVFLGRGVVVEEGAVIHAFSYLEGAKIGRHVQIGPYARLRPHVVVEEGAQIGNFVEAKGARIEEGAKVKHLSYIGDIQVGAGANIGAGTIICNYDGVNKHKTYIGAGAFIGSNSALVAPVTIGAGAIVAAGSVITKDVTAEALALTRSEQREKPGAATRFRNKHRG